MKATILGMRRQKGVSAKTGNDYDMAMLILQVPIESVANEKITINGRGFETSTMPYDTDKEAFFQSITFPATVDLITESRPRYGNFEVVAIGAKPLESKPASQG